MCQYQPQCPQSWKPDRLAAQIEDDTELVIASLTARRERENCGYVRTLLARKQPQFARALAFAEQELACRGEVH